MRHKAGYLVWQFGTVHWHRTLKEAIKRATEFWARESAQVIECATENLVFGKPQ